MKDLLAQIHPQMPKAQYFKLLYQHSEVIMTHIGHFGKIETGKALGMSPQAFSTFFPCMQAHLDIIADNKEQ